MAYNSAAAYMRNFFARIPTMNAGYNIDRLYTWHTQGCVENAV